MPLDGFKILDWATATFGGMPPAVIGGMGVAVLIAGVALMIIGAKLVPVSWGLVIAGGSCVALTYFIVAAAIAGTGSPLEGGQHVASAAPRTVPIAVAAFAFGLAMFTARSALRSWISEETSGKVTAVIFVLLVFALIFFSVQIIRGSFWAIQHQAPTEATFDDTGPEPEPIRRGVTAPRRR